MILHWDMQELTLHSNQKLSFPTLSLSGDVYGASGA